ncbi:MAG TPA: hypothetical protein VFO73_12565, partial [Candidatus Limnocylindrales bacterium]|nr:hypothetical protein [Candidatus Limnocylindrales bacterium]
PDDAEIRGERLEVELEPGGPGQRREVRRREAPFDRRAPDDIVLAGRRAGRGASQLVAPGSPSVATA